MADTIDDIADKVMGALYRFVGKAAGDIDAADADDPFVAWCKPGIPFAPEDFDFARNMLVAQGASEEEKAADLMRQLTQAAGFSRFVDFVPSSDGVVGGDLRGGVLRPGRAALSDVYKRVLDASQVAQIPEPAGIDEQLATLQAQAKPLEDAYMAAQTSYEEAKAAYVGARLVASLSAVAGIEFQAKGPALKAKVNQARQKWEIDGNKTRYENLIGEILSLRSRRSPAIWRTEALAKYDDLPEGQNATFGEARLTMPFPGSFAARSEGWTDFAFSTSSSAASQTRKSSKWGAEAGGGWKSFKLGGSASGSTSEALNVTRTSGFGIKMKVAQVHLLRSWFDPWFLRSEFWRFNPGSIEGQDGSVVTDGAVPPGGLLIGYPVSALFVQGVEIKLDELKDENSELVKTLKAEGGGGWGFGVISAKAQYERNSEVKQQAVDVANGVLKIPGLQLVGFVIEQMGQQGQALPRPKEGLVWAGGTP